MANLKALTEAGHHVHVGKVKAHAGAEGNILADAATRKIVTQKIIGSGGDLNDIPHEDLEGAGIALLELSAIMHIFLSIMSGLYTLSPSIKAWKRERSLR